MLLTVIHFSYCIPKLIVPPHSSVPITSLPYWQLLFLWPQFSENRIYWESSADQAASGEAKKQNQQKYNYKKDQPAKPSGLLWHSLI